MLESRLKKSLLEQFYLKEGLSLRQIAKKLDKSKFGIHYWMYKYKIPLRSFKIKLSIKKQAIELYKKGESTWSIAKKLDIASSSVKRFLEETGTKVRSRKEAAKLGFKEGRIKISKHSIPEESKTLTKEKAYIIGVLCGDACIDFSKKHRRYHIVLSATDKDFIVEFKRCMEKVYGIPLKMYLVKSKVKEWRDKFQVRLCSKEACLDLLKLGDFKTESWKVPKEIMKSSKEVKSLFLKGFFDSEGHVERKTRRIGVTSISTTGIEDVQEILQSFGIRSGIQTKEAKGTRKEAYQLRIQDRRSVEKYAELIGLL